MFKPQNYAARKIKSLLFLSLPEEYPEDLKIQFNCLTSFEHCSSIIHGNLLCYGNEFTSLKGFPKIIDDELISEQSHYYRKWITKELIKRSTL